MILFPKSTNNIIKTFDRLEINFVTLIIYSNSRDMLAFIFIPVIQKELDDFKNVVWNHKRGRKQLTKELPTGIPEFIYDNPEEFGVEDSGSEVTEDLVVSVGLAFDINLDGVFIYINNYQAFSAIIPDANYIKSNDTIEAFLYLKANYTPSPIMRVKDNFQ